ncbi:hypothetical protein AMECASPLE_028885, partial [Ameca splendens]
MRFCLHHPYCHYKATVIVCFWVGPACRDILRSHKVPLELESRGCDRCGSFHHQLESYKRVDCQHFLAGKCGDIL